MKVGIKVGPDNWDKRLLLVKPDCLEVWFRLDWYKRYFPLFKHLQKEKIPFGLHFWAMIKDKYLPNMLGSNIEISDETYKSILKTIDIASKWQATYVNFHPESYREVWCDLDNSTSQVINPNQKFNRQKSFSQLLFYLKKIKAHAAEKKVIPFIETIVKYTTSDFNPNNRLKLQKSEGLETEKYFILAKLKQPVCLDIGHTLAQFITEDREKLFNYLYKAAKKMLPSIGLIHVTTNVPPFNGTDSHNGVLPQDFKLGALPDRKQLIQLLTLFKDKDVWLIPEPAIDKMLDNYFALREIVKEIGEDKGIHSPVSA